MQIYCTTPLLKSQYVPIGSIIKINIFNIAYDVLFNVALVYLPRLISRPSSFCPLYLSLVTRSCHVECANCRLSNFCSIFLSFSKYTERNLLKLIWSLKYLIFFPIFVIPFSYYCIIPKANPRSHTHIHLYFLNTIFLTYFLLHK